MPETQRGIQQFIGSMQGVVARMAPRDRWLELGRIRPDYALEIVDSVHSATGKPLVYKLGQYQVLRHLCNPLDYISTTPDGATPTRDPDDPLAWITPATEGGHGGHSGGGSGDHVHHVLTTRPQDSILPGDLVEVHWLTGYSDPIVAGAIITSRSLPGALALGLVSPSLATAATPASVPIVAATPQPPPPPWSGPNGAR